MTNLDPNQPQGPIIPPDPTNELPAGTSAPISATPTPPAAPVEKALEDKLAELEKQATTPTPTTPAKPVGKKRKRWIVWLVLLLLLVAGAAVWYFFFRLPAEQAYQPVEVLDERNSTITYRSSTFPTANLTIQRGVATLTTRVLNPLPAAPYKLVLAKMDNTNTIPGLPQSGDPNVVSLGNFDINAEGKVIAEDSGENTFQVSGDTSAYNTALVMIDSGERDGSAVLLGRLARDEAAGAIITSKLAFPIDFSTISGSLRVMTVEGKKYPTLQINFNTLPDIAYLGYTYEAHLVQFEGPYVKKDEAIGRFPGNRIGVHIDLPLRAAIDNYTNVVISLEPTWDTDKDISQIKPFIAEL